MQATIPRELALSRFDQALAAMLPDYSRSRIQRWIKDGLATLDGRTVSPRHKVSGGERVTVRPCADPNGRALAQPMGLDLVYEDDHILVINKPAGLVVHPGAGNRDGTLLNGLLHHAPELADVPRAGIVHRLDKNTTGLLVVARTLQAHARLVEALGLRHIHREYEAIVHGRVTGGGRVDAPLGRHRSQRTRMTVTHAGKPAVTRFRIRARFPAHTHLVLALETGRTHQIRVHMAHMGHPIVGDRDYGGRARVPRGATEALARYIRDFPRQALHASRLALKHPATRQPCEFKVALPVDMQRLIERLAPPRTADL